MLTKEGSTTDFANMSLEDIALGNAMDTFYTLLLYRELKKDLSKNFNPTFLEFYSKVLIPLNSFFAKTSFEGIDVSRQELIKLEKEVRNKLVTLEDEVYKVGNLTPKDNINSPKNLSEILYLGNDETKGLFLRDKGFNLMWPEETDTEQPKTDVEALKFILDSVRLELQERG